jgi:hypothetical protein
VLDEPLPGLRSDLAISILESGEALVEAVEALHQCLHPKKAVLMHRVETVEAVEVFFYNSRNRNGMRSLRDCPQKITRKKLKSFSKMPLPPPPATFGCIERLNSGGGI